MRRIDLGNPFLNDHGHMKNRILFVGCFVIAILAAPGTSRAADSGAANGEQQVRKLEREWLDALVKRDGDYLQKLEAEDFTMTGPDGKLLSKDEDIKSTMSGNMVYEDIKLDDLKVRLHGETSIATGIGSVQAHSKDESMNGKYSSTDVFVKMNGEWKAVAAHVTVVAPEKK
jgi:ketosteroid isomerase-like protein